MEGDRRTLSQNNSMFKYADDDTNVLVLPYSDISLQNDQVTSVLKCYSSAWLHCIY